MEHQSGEPSENAIDPEEERELEHLRELYKTLVEEWIAAIREEETLAQPINSVAGVDVWEKAHFKEEEARDKAKQARRDYQDGLRKALYDFYCERRNRKCERQLDPDCSRSGS